MKNALTVDLEDYFHVSAYSGKVRLEEWDSYPSRVAENTDRLLDLLAENDCLATFFRARLGGGEKNRKLLGGSPPPGTNCVPQPAAPQNLRLDPQEFREDTHRAKAVIEDATGKKVVGYRAPSFFGHRESSWALDILAEQVFNTIPACSRCGTLLWDSRCTPDSVLINTPSGRILEFPMPTLAIGSMRSPIGGGAYLRFLPYSYTRWAIRHLNQHEEFPVCVYIHPWSWTRNSQGWVEASRRGCGTILVCEGRKSKLKKLVSDMEFCPLGTLISEMGPGVAQHSM